MTHTVAVLFARADSIYKQLPGCDVWDLERDALTWPGGAPIVAHPPCRAWGGLSHFAKPQPGERELAVWAVRQVQRHSGVLEHPRASRLWPECGLPCPGQRDQYGGFTWPIHQNWFGHRAEKATLLYIVGCEPGDMPAMPLSLHMPTHVVSPAHSIRVGHPRYRPQLRKPEREATPPQLAEWLCAVARLCARHVEVADLFEANA